jgi:endonuclease/exonuclease/phosphatase family metal-dependent hydrolase
LRDNPPFTAAGLVWPWLTPWQVASARRAATELVPAGATPFRLVSANALGPNKLAVEFAAEAVAIDTDVLIVVEASAAILDALEAAEVSRFHQHGIIEKRRRWSGCGIWSRHPIEVVEVGDAGHAYIAATVSLPGGPVTVVAVHTWAPAKPRGGVRWLQSFAVLDDLIGRLLADGHRVVAAGDYNATMGHRPLRRLLSQRNLRDAHDVTGRGLAHSWPETWWFPAVALIDRVLVSDGIAVRSVAEQAMAGSDHRALVADLLVSPP